MRVVISTKKNRHRIELHSPQEMVRRARINRRARKVVTNGYTPFRANKETWGLLFPEGTYSQRQEKTWETPWENPMTIYKDRDQIEQEIAKIEGDIALFL